MTINYLLYINKKEPFINNIKAVQKSKKYPYKVNAACKDFMTILNGNKV